MTFAINLHKIMKIYLATILLLVDLLAGAADTNALYVTDDGFVVGQSRNGELRLNPKKVEEAKKSKESLPAEEFPEGNWGNAQNGFQLSVRFEKQTFTLEEPITAIILLRNVTNQTLIYNVSDVVGRCSPIGLVVIDENGKPAAFKSDEIDVVSSHARNVFPKTQQKFKERLDSVYALQTNTLYMVSASVKVACPHCVEIQSAQASIKIVDSFQTNLPPSKL
jgi:hypothetical protein